MCIADVGTGGPATRPSMSAYRHHQPQRFDINSVSQMWESPGASGEGCCPAQPSDTSSCARMHFRDMQDLRLEEDHKYFDDAHHVWWEVGRIVFPISLDRALGP
ncbi:uncharacterized protein [Dermacentor albipictus]|uniref:uncharacterized protein isoform X3 n=1 Tax=Dermacentor albipictus TaxID=60249 RepID=UPI0038FD2C19